VSRTAKHRQPYEGQDQRERHSLTPINLGRRCSGNQKLASQQEKLVL
jgi:hypothetical protein